MRLKKSASDIEMKSMRFQAIIRKHKDWIYTYALYFLGNENDAKDVTQEVLLKVWQNITRIKTGATRTWITKTTRNLCIDYVRRNRTIQRHFEPITDDIAELVSDKNPDSDPLETTHITIVAEHIQNALEYLPDIQKSAVIMRDVQDMSYREISKILDLPLNTTKVYIMRGRQALRDNLTQRFKINNVNS
jgi:RNA polymerase sigma-70 factor (ECF subfamily)